MRPRRVLFRAVLATVVPGLIVELCLQLGAGVVALTKSTVTPATEAPCAVLCVGDSFTYGLGASDPANSYPARLEQLLRTAPIAGRSHVVNGGWPGSNSRNILENLSRQFEEMPPKFVAVMVGINDMWSRPERFEIGDAPRDEPAGKFRFELRRPRLCRLLFTNPTTLEDVSRVGEGVAAATRANGRALPPLASKQPTQRQQDERSLTARWRAAKTTLDLQAGGGCVWDGRRWTWDIDERELLLTPLFEGGTGVHATWELKGNRLEVEVANGGANYSFARVAVPAAGGNREIAEGRKATTRKDDSAAVEIFSRAIAKFPDQP
ncbi:MAG: SGNH/GDSL hydrolase family protein [Planctomycetes bacterium]|nr:SGNH/GDSL hydrolase family protein [Planctomycetota bacterium]